MKYLFILSFIFITFFSGTLSSFLGVQQTVLFAYTPFVCYFLLKQRKSYYGAVNRHALGIIYLAVFLYIFKLIGLGQDYFKTYLCFLVFPMIISMDLEFESEKRIALLRNILLIFFVAECSLAIYERITETNIFYDPHADIAADQLKYLTVESWEFRSTAFFSHPLMNAMVVGVIMSFILIGDMKPAQKLIYFALGYVSLWCFNARGAILVSTVLLIPYMLWMIKKSNFKHKRWLYFFSIVAILYFANLVMTTSLGGRLIQGDKVIDGSAQTRLDVFSFYLFLDLEELLWGGPDLYIDVMNKLQAGGVENGFISMVLSHGLIFAIIIVAFVFSFQLSKLKQVNLNKYSLIVNILFFYVLGNMNPALASATPYTFWILSYYSFLRCNSALNTKK